MDKHETATTAAQVHAIVRWSSHDGDGSIGLRRIWKGWIGDKRMLTVWEKITHSSWHVSGECNRYMGSAERNADIAKSEAVKRAVELGVL